MKNCKQLRHILPLYEQVFVLADSKIASRIPQILGEYRLQRFPTLEIEAKEENKSLATVEKIWSFLLEQDATRKALLINIGGGLICDVGGFAAATYKRGIDFLNIPTTLLAMADAAHGGKTGFNYRGLKNAIGLIRQPVSVLIEPAWLSTLSEKELLSGYAEILKCGLLDDVPSFADAIIGLDKGDYTAALPMAIEYKEGVVERDEQEEDFRKVLNLGHTVGHALEELWAEQGTPVPHGFCVMYGLVAALYLSVTQLDLEKEVLTEMTHLMIDFYGRPVCDCKDYRHLIDLIYKDKKNTRAHETAFTLLRHIGDPLTNCPVSDSALREALDYLMTV